MASAATLGYQSLPQTSAFTVSPAQRSGSGSRSQYWSSNSSQLQPSGDSDSVIAGSAAHSSNAGTSDYISQSESPNRKRRKTTVSQSVAGGASVSETTRASRPRSLRRRNTAAAIMQAQHMAAPHHHEREHGTVRGRRSPRNRRSQYQYNSHSSHQSYNEPTERQQQRVGYHHHQQNMSAATAHMPPSVLAQHPHLLTAATHNHLQHHAAAAVAAASQQHHHQQSPPNNPPHQPHQSHQPHQPRPFLVDLSQVRQMPVSGATAYPVPTICTGISRPSFYMTNQLPNPVQSQNVCSSIHVPWPCVQARLPNHQMPNASHNLQTTPAGLNPMMSFASAGHNGAVSSAAQLNTPPNQSRMMSHPRRAQGMMSELAPAERGSYLHHPAHGQTSAHQHIPRGVAPGGQPVNHPPHIRTCPALQVAQQPAPQPGPQPQSAGILFSDHMQHQRGAMDVMAAQSGVSAGNPYTRFNRSFPSRRMRHMPVTSAFHPQLHGAPIQHPALLLQLWAMLGNQQGTAGPFRVAEFPEETPEVENYEALLNLAERLGEAKPRGLPKSNIQQLTSYRFGTDTERDSTKDQTSCVVCMCDFESDHMLRVLPCSHEFHLKCVDKWLKCNRTCPICRADAAVKTVKQASKATHSLVH